MAINRQGTTQEQAQERPKGRIDHPAGKQQYLDKVEEEPAQEQERPKGRIDHPEGKQQYLDKVEEEPAQEQERPKGRIDHPEGKQQYLDKENPEPVPVEDKSTVTISYTVKVMSFGNDEAFVRKTVLGARRKNSAVKFPITVTFGEKGSNDALALAKSLQAVDAQVEVKKNISIEIPII